MKKNFIIILFFGVLPTMFTACYQGKRALPSLNETYRKSDKQPFGAFVAYQEFRHLFNDRYIETVSHPFDEEWNNIKDYSDDNKYSLYFLIAKNLVLNEDEVKAFIDYVKAGNDLFISADYIDNRLLENMDFNTQRSGEIVDEAKGLMHQTNVSMYFHDYFNTPKYQYYYYPFLNSVSDYDTAFARVLGVNEIKQPNYIILFAGKGRIYIHVAPRIFSNYFLLSSNNHLYFENVISYLRSDPKNIYWDEYYKNTAPGRRRNKRNNADDNFSSLSVINQNPPLRWAFWLVLVGLIFYLLFNIKRKQRIINIIKPNANTTVNFTETVGRLYLQKQDNKHIAEKMITYFYEHIRNKYFISTATINEEFINALSGKSSISKQSTAQLCSFINQIQSGEEVDDEDLMKLNTAIEDFYKNKI